MNSVNPKIALLVSLLFLFTVYPSVPSYAQTPEFEPKSYIYAGGQVIDPGSMSGFDNYFSVPCVVDWNNDGKKDLLVGSFYYGNIYLYLNSGDNNSPVFDTEVKLTDSNGYDIAVAYG